MISSLDSQHPDSQAWLDASFRLRDCMMQSFARLFSVALMFNPDLIILECFQLFLSATPSEDFDTCFAFWFKEKRTSIIPVLNNIYLKKCPVLWISPDACSKCRYLVWEVGSLWRGLGMCILTVPLLLVFRLTKLWNHNCNGCASVVGKMLSKMQILYLVIVNL